MEDGRVREWMFLASASWLQASCRAEVEPNILAKKVQGEY
jgi:hypothetical protein